MKTTLKHFEYFKEHCQVWLAYWGLTDWRVQFIHAPSALEDGSNPMSYTTACTEQMFAVISFSDNQPESLITPKEVAEAAFHEIAELLAMPLQIHAMSRWSTEEQIDSASHALIQRLTNTIFEDYWTDCEESEEPLYED